MNVLSNFVGAVMVTVLAVIGLGLLMSLPVMWLWNFCLVPAIPAVKTISWLQSWGLMVLINLLCKPNVSAKKTS